MKKTLISAYSILFMVSAASIILSISGGNQQVVSYLILATVVFSVFILNHWLAFVKKLVLKSNLTLNKKEAAKTKWSFANLENLEKNQDQVLNKINNSVKYITNLAHPEKSTNGFVFDADDPIGKALLNITSEMQKVKEDDAARTWITQGLVRFSEILHHKSDIKEYSYNIISNLVKYIKANQGVLFIEYQDETNERFLEPKACYAYDNLKILENKIYEGQGMVGQCMLEKDFIIVNDVPETYAKITSGLGEAPPRSIVVAPLIFNEVFCGVIEIASFEILKPHHLEFLKAVCEDIASEIVSLKTMEHTKGLLEESNSLTHELQSREEEMKHNLEELAATQEEMSQKQTELAGILNAIDATLATAELDIMGGIIRHNSILEEFTGYNTQELSKKDYTLITGAANIDVSWGKILNGTHKSGDFKTRSKNGEALWLSVTFTPIYDGNNHVEKLLCMIQNITQKKIKEKEFERLSLVADNTDNSVIITDNLGLIEYVNYGFTKMTGYEPSEVIGKKPGTILQGPLTDKRTVQKLREQLAAGVPIYEEILNYNKRNKTYWVSLAINPVKDKHGITQKLISIQSDITQTKLKAMDFHQKMEALSRSNAIAEFDKNGILLDINENYLELLNYSREELIRKPYAVLSQSENTFHKILDTIDEHGLQSGVFSRYDKNGNRHYMKLIDYPVLNLHGEIEKIIEFGQDVSNEKRLEKEAERREAELKSYLIGVNNTIASAEFGTDGRFKNANEIFTKVMGYTNEELEGKFFEYMMGDEPNIVMMWENLRLGKFFSGEFKMKNKAGKELWLTGTFNPMVIEGNKPEKIMMFAQFTTQEKEKLNDLNAMVQALKSTIPVLEFNPDFVCKTANDKALRFFGLSRLDLRSKNILDFLAPDYHEAWNKNKEKIITSDFTNFLLPFVGEADVKNYEVSITVTRNLDGNIGKIIFLLVKEVQDRVPALAMN
ncbi:MAG TPA: PAS domain S-box protein [Cyclobacteriaceae bacterium]